MQQGAPPTPQMSVVTVHRTSVPVTIELSGRTTPYLVAQVRARVNGIVLKRDHKEGSGVKAGQRLYTIDPAPYIAQQVASLERNVVASQRYLDLAQQRFQSGIDSYLNVLTAQTTLYTAQQMLVSARMTRLTTLVDLYRALGGGWIEHTGDAPPAAEDIASMAPHNDAPWDFLKSGAIRPR